MISSFILIDQKTKFLIEVFKNNKYREYHEEYLIEEISQINTYQYFYLINAVLLHLTPEIDLYRILFLIDEETYIFSNCVKHNFNLIKRISYRKKKFNLKDYSIDLDSYPLYNRLYNLYELRSRSGLFMVEKIIYDICLKLNYLDQEYPNFYRGNLIDNFDDTFFSLLINDEDNVKYDILDIINETSTHIKDTLIVINKMSIYDFSIDSKIIMPLIIGVDEWKKTIAKDILQSENTFLAKKLFYLECLIELEKRTRESSFSSRELVNFTPFYEDDNYFILDHLKEWIDDNFDVFKTVNQVKFNSTRKKYSIEISPIFGQVKLRNVILRFLSDVNVDVTIGIKKKVEGFIFYYTLCPNAHHKKRIFNTSPYLKIDFVPRNYIDDFARIFLNLQHSSLSNENHPITSKKSDLEKFFQTHFSNYNLSYSKLRRMKLKFPKKLEEFENYLTAQKREFSKHLPKQKNL